MAIVEAFYGKRHTSVLSELGLGATQALPPLPTVFLQRTWMAGLGMLQGSTIVGPTGSNGPPALG